MFAGLARSEACGRTCILLGNRDTKSIHRPMQQADSAGAQIPRKHAHQSADSRRPSSKHLHSRLALVIPHEEIGLPFSADR
jgi:hypothetical protein